MKHNEMQFPVYAEPEVKETLIRTEAGFCVSTGTREQFEEDEAYIW